MTRGQPRLTHSTTDANADGKVVCFFKAAAKFDGRYAVLGFEDAATLDEPPMWPVVFAIVEWTPAVEKKAAALGQDRRRLSVAYARRGRLKA